MVTSKKGSVNSSGLEGFTERVVNQRGFSAITQVGKKIGLKAYVFLGV